MSGGGSPKGEGREEDKPIEPLTDDEWAAYTEGLGVECWHRWIRKGVATGTADVVWAPLSCELCGAVVAGSERPAVVPVVKEGTHK